MFTTAIKRVLNRNLEITRRISDSDAKQVNNKLSKLPDVESTIPKLQEAITSSAWETNVTINHPDMPFYALLALQEKILQETSFTTLMLYWSATQMHPQGDIQSQPLFRNNEINIHSWDLLAQTQRDCSDRKSMFLTNEEYLQFFKEIKKYPESEQQFFTVPDVPETNSIVREIELTGVNIFGRIGNQQRIIPSLGMMQTYLHVKFATNAAHVNPVLGFSSIEDIRQNGLTQQRDLGLHFPRVYLPHRADGRSALWYRFTAHDLYHNILASCVPFAHQVLFVKCSDAMLNYLQKKLEPFVTEITHFFEKPIAKIIADYLSEPDAATVRTVAIGFIDMEHPYYRPDNSFSDYGETFKFWSSIGMTFTKPNEYNKFYEEQKSTKSFSPMTDETKEGVCTHLFSVVAEDKELISFPRSGFNELLSLFAAGKKNFHDPNRDAIRTELTWISNVWQQTHVIELLDSELKPLLLQRGESKTESVKAFITSRVEPNFTVRNIVSIFQYARENSIRELQQSCMKFMCLNLNSLVFQPSFCQFRQSNPELVIDIFNNVRKSCYFGKAFKAALDTPQALEVLLPTKENINQMDAFGLTALDYAVKFGRKEIVLKLLAQGANPNPLPGSKAMPTLFSAIYHAKGDIFDILFKQGFNTDLTYKGKDWFGYYCSLLEDPETCAGISKDFALSMQKNGSYSFSDSRKAALFAKAKNTSGQGLSFFPFAPEDLASMPSQMAAELCYERVREDISWACQRLDYKRP